MATSRSTPYNPQGNGQVERLNGTLWKAITLALKTQKLPTTKWELVLCDALHSIRSLLCTETNSTPHERIFLFSRRSTNGSSVPQWLLTPGPVYLKRSVRSSKYDPMVDEVQLLDANPQYAHIRLADGRESTVSLRQLAPVGEVNREEILSPEDPVSALPGQDLLLEDDAPDSGPTPEPDLPTAPARPPSEGTNTPFVRTSYYNLRSGRR